MRFNDQVEVKKFVQTNQGLLPTPLSKQSFNYIKDMETRSNIPIQAPQQQFLKQALQENKFEKLTPDAKIAHSKQYDKIRNNLINEWEANTGQKWPVYTQDLYNKANSRIAEAGKKLQIHHIIPQQVGGPHTWWNIHPLGIPDHQLGVHLPKAPLSQILKDTTK